MSSNDFNNIQSTEQLSAEDATKEATAQSRDRTAIQVRDDSSLHRRKRERDKRLSVISPRIGLNWNNIYYQVPIELAFKQKLKPKRPKKQWKELLRGVSGEAMAGEIIGIMGSSGAGKTTLLNILAGRIQSGEITGLVKVNGHKRGPNWRRVAAYVEQDDVMYSQLTVRETLEFAAFLKLPSEMSREEKSARVDRILEVLGLDSVQRTRIGDSEHRGISGGERKRVAIGIEMVTEPRLIFMDEPTTGLDAFTAQSVVHLMHELATVDKRTIIVTVHQPRANILHLFTRILLLSQGKAVFFGTLQECLDFFKQNGLECPTLENPADFFIDMITIDFQSPEARETSQERIAKLHDAWTRIEGSAKTTNQISRFNGLAVPTMPQSSLDNSATASNNTDHLQSVTDAKPASMSVEHEQSEANKQSLLDKDPTDKDLTWPCLWTTEFYYLLKRNFKIAFRDVTTLIAQVVQTIIIFLLLGFIFFQLPDTFPGIQGRLGVLFFIPINLTFTIVTPLISIFALDRAIILRERYSATYRVSSAYLARFVSLIPVRTFLTLFFAASVYWLIGLRSGFQYFLVFAGFLLLISLNAICMGLFIAAIAPSVELGQVIGSLIIVVFLIFGGNLANADSVTWILRWIQYISPIFYAFEGLIQNELAGQTFNGIPGDFYLNEYSLNQIPPIGCAGGLLGLAILFLALGYVALRRVTRPKFMLI